MLAASFGAWLRRAPELAATLAALACGGGLGVAAAYVTVAMHLVSPDNPLAGLGMGYGGTILGAVAAFIAVRKIGARNDP